MNNFELNGTTILLLPGLGNSDADHWQTHWEASFGYERVEQQDWDKPSADEWVEGLHKRIMADECPKILVAHSLACALVAHWSRLHRGPVVAALLVAPSDVEGSNYPPGPVGFAPMPLQALNMRSLVVAGDDDIYVPLERGRQFARAWGSEYVLLGQRGHIGSAAKLGIWPEGLDLLGRLVAPKKICAN